MLRLLKLLLVATFLLPVLTGVLAVSLGFGDSWGMGSKDPWGIFMTAALPFLVPGLYQIYAWPPTFGGCRPTCPGPIRPHGSSGMTREASGHSTVCLLPVS